MSPRAKACAVLAVGVFAAAWASILVRWGVRDAPPAPLVEAGRWLLGWLSAAGWAGAGKAPPLVIATGRMVLAALLLTPVALGARVPRELRALDRRGLLLVLLSGLALALHFATWISSLDMTTVASSVVLVSTHPLFVGLAAHFLLRERVSRLTAAGIGLAMVGSALVGYGDFGLSGVALLGDLLALVGGVMAAAYFLLGRRLRQRLPILAYIWPVYAVAAVVLLAICLATGQRFDGYAPEVYLMALLLAVGPQLLGHSSVNYALGQLSAVFVTVVVLGEPIGSSLLALLLLGEIPPLLAIFGGAMILGGIVLAGRGEGRRGEPAPEACSEPLGESTKRPD